ncbi:predicted protein [Pyrenophora tritici-repentis Pt-1C-BFP]|uniref:Uncharacterized protein n=1 Tax=Pyrenophora tritici-repentis (strain Pt-1C-BFP) TaxID=426418 RepID=B2W645_PYRTR|nr:uncharacterized protein PTRG_06203 [Pyrenophora tritici-repentis Pt-1C-BFP]EDU49123.1 predicted protein [Pyrenophora tritici-repentis Pt-1C-BFP]
MSCPITCLHNLLYIWPIRPIQPDMHDQPIIPLQRALSSLSSYRYRQDPCVLQITQQDPQAADDYPSLTRDYEAIKAFVIHVYVLKIPTAPYTKQILQPPSQSPPPILKLPTVYNHALITIKTPMPYCYHDTYEADDSFGGYGWFCCLGVRGGILSKDAWASMHWGSAGSDEERAKRYEETRQDDACPEKRLDI